MGYSRKEEISKLRRERKEAKAAKKRKENVREKLVRFLIVCEGTKTEPHYFEALINSYISAVREVKIEGEGRATVALVDRTQEIKAELERKNAMSFDRVWVVFDKDDFDDFNDAIKKAHKLGFQSAWTNEAFELWYYLHFEYLDTGIGREAYIDKLQDAFRKKMCDDNYKYSKGNPEIYNLLQKYGREDLAKRFARQLRALYTGTNYATHKPCTMVDKLVKELEYQILSGTSKPEWQIYHNYYVVSPTTGTISYFRRMISPYGDDPRDQQWIKEGFQYYKTFIK